ncbi:WD40/YVTN/BNR-like repeat-containing protein [Mucilaginibacter agri]|uniref:Sortilin N-terminal domain-containing protein n=1 Tax=Mucilaginibacter agri TaxID=2695265 RepID=A0A965ZHT9_9SPHI|nr:sialidase family protein [Mucilaginibacter agri]NCD71358.1 hypothetical protein [Mucilaginibacter agri]
MNLRNFCYVLLLSVALASCKKDGSSKESPSNADKYQLTIINGNNQTDTVGLMLKDSIVIKATNNDKALTGYHIQFLRAGCAEDLTNELITTAEGKVVFRWWLAGNAGQQNLKVRLLDTQNKPLDSITVNSTALAHKGVGWHLSACVPFTASLNKFCKLSTGRIFASLGKAYVRYSDDNGNSWFPVKGLGDTHNIVSILAGPKDELVALAFQEGIYYSKDAGLTWTFMGTTPFANEVFWDMAMTRTGKLIYTSRQRNVYLSEDYGKTWKLLNNGLTNNPYAYTYPTEAQNGDLYLVDDNGVLYKSTDAGANWKAVTSHINDGVNFEQVVSLYCANNGWLYKGRQDPTGGLFVSKDNGATYSRLLNLPNSFVFMPSMAPNGYIYFHLLFSGLFLYDGNAARKIWDDEGAGRGTPYIIANNGAVIVSSRPAIRFYN